MDATKEFGLSAFTLKIIAIIAMTCNHIVIVYEDFLPVAMLFLLNSIGGLTFPIMAYMAVEGYRKTSNVKRYMLRLLVFGLISIVPAYMLLGRLSVIITILLGVFSLYLHDRMKSKALFWLSFIGIILFTVVCDWSLIGVPLIFAYGTIKGEKKRVILSTLSILGAGMIIIAAQSLAFTGDWNTQLALDVCFMMVGFCVIPLLLHYNGKRGYSPRSLRYLFYIYYPAHMAVLAALQIMIEKN